MHKMQRKAHWLIWHCPYRCAFEVYFFSKFSKTFLPQQGVQAYLSRSIFKFHFQEVYGWTTQKPTWKIQMKQLRSRNHNQHYNYILVRSTVLNVAGKWYSAIYMVSMYSIYIRILAIFATSATTTSDSIHGSLSEFRFFFFHFSYEQESFWLYRIACIALKIFK